MDEKKKGRKLKKPRIVSITEGKKRGMLSTEALIGGIATLLLFVVFAMPVTQSIVSATAAQNSAVNESIGTTAVTNQVYSGGSNVTANDAACGGYFTWNVSEVWAYNSTNGVYKQLTAANFTGYPNGTIAWSSLSQGLVDGASNYNQTNVTYSCYQNNLSLSTITVLNQAPLLVIVAILIFIAFFFIMGYAKVEL